MPDMPGANTADAPPPIRRTKLNTARTVADIITGYRTIVAGVKHAPLVRGEVIGILRALASW
jgi:hypothetical protein